MKGKGKTNHIKQTASSTVKKQNEPIVLPFAQLSNTVGSIINALSSANSELFKFKKDFEDYRAASWQKERALERNYYQLIENMLGLIDNIEAIRENRQETAKANGELQGLSPSDAHPQEKVLTGSVCSYNENNIEDIVFIYQKLLQILQRERIQEISAMPGDRFDIRYHKCHDTSINNQNEATIQKVLQKGYLIKPSLHKEEEIIIIRPATVALNKGLKKDYLNVETSVQEEK